MNAIALIMAGGQGQRMRRSAIEQAKPLVEIRGVPLLERNLRMLLRDGFRQIVIAVPRTLPEIGRFVKDRCQALARAAGASIEMLVEEKPLGNIGCAGLLRDRAANIFVVYADNLTTLDLAAVLRAHLGADADLTLAVHDEQFRIPFGRVQIDRRRVTAYEEKPLLSVPVCSAISVLGRKAVAALPTDRPTGISELAQTMIATSAEVLAYCHSAPWIDVNDAETRLRAEQLIAHEESFDLWWPTGRSQRLVLVLLCNNEILFTSGQGSSSLGLPHLPLEPAEIPEQAALRLGRKYVVSDGTEWRRVAAFDDLGPDGQAILRTAVVIGRTEAQHKHQGVWLPWTRDKLVNFGIDLGSWRTLAICESSVTGAPL